MTSNGFRHRSEGVWTRERGYERRARRGSHIWTHTRVFDPHPRWASPVRMAAKSPASRERPVGTGWWTPDLELSLELRDESAMNSHMRREDRLR
jgi:hypothetical protein